MARTRMQAALPIRVADRITSWSAPLASLHGEIGRLRRRTECLACAGPVGTGPNLSLAVEMAAALGLNPPRPAGHTDRTPLSDYAHWLAQITTALGKIGQDIALMAQQGLNDIDLDGGGKSSAMPHKANPIRAEALVTLARFNATLLPGMYQVHEQERSGISWALEWLMLPQMAEATGASLSNAEALLAQIKSIGSPR
ncbi:MAG: lyase family protein, partial [Pseudomonadota bacterium]